MPSRFINEIPNKYRKMTEIINTEDFEFNQDNSIEFDNEYKVQASQLKKINRLNGKNKTVKRFLRKYKVGI